MSVIPNFYNPSSKKKYKPVFCPRIHISSSVLFLNCASYLTNLRPPRKNCIRMVMISSSPGAISQFHHRSLGKYWTSASLPVESHDPDHLRRPIRNKKISSCLFNNQACPRDRATIDFSCVIPALRRDSAKHIDHCPLYPIDSVPPTAIQS